MNALKAIRNELDTITSCLTETQSAIDKLVNNIDKLLSDILTNYQIDNIEVRMFDEPGEFAWDSMESIDGWRLPTDNELSLIYDNKDKINGLTSNNYWSITEDIASPKTAWTQCFASGLRYPLNKYSKCSIRAVRDIHFEN
jgi:hypothetical protein